MTTPDVWEVERACRLAWPAREEHTFGGWLARLSGGDTRRPNSVNPLRADAADPVELLADLAPLYQRCGLPLIFRVPHFMAAADNALSSAGFRAGGRTHTLTMPLASGLVCGLPDKPSAAWLAARALAGGGDSAATEAIIERLTVPAGFAATVLDDKIAAVGFAAIAGDIAVIESLRTAARFRRRGAARALMGDLLSWASGRGARHVILQVAADNAPALALYRSLGFGPSLYDYHYRVAP